MPVKSRTHLASTAEVADADTKKEMVCTELPNPLTSMSVSLELASSSLASPSSSPLPFMNWPYRT